MNKLSFALAQVLGAGAAITVAATPVFAQQAQRIERIEVTGSNIKRIEGESALPVTIITREEIATSGATTVGELLDKLSATSGGAYALAAGLGEAGSPGTTTVSLRGLGETNTLILLNGRRLANYAFAVTGGATNLNQIPISLIERVEVLRDGASAVYGTDAIGGVINFILRRDFSGAEVSAYGTKTDRGGGDTQRYTAAVGYGDPNKQRFNIMAAFDYQKDDPLAARERTSFTGTGIRPDMGFTQISSRTYGSNFTFAGVSYNLTAAQGCLPSVGSYQVDSAGRPDPQRRNCVYDYSSVLDIYPPTERKGVFVRGVLQFSNDHQAFLEYHKQENEITFAVSETPMVPDRNGNWFYPAGGRYYPGTFTDARGNRITPTGNLSVALRMKPTGRRTNRVDTEEDRLVVGLQGVLAAWDYNTAYTDSNSKASDNYVDGYVNSSLLRPVIASGNVDVFSGKPQDAAAQALFDATKIIQKVREAENKVQSIDGRVSREIMQTRSGPIGLALGFEFRKEEMKDTVDAIFSSGDILGGGGNFQNQSGDRDVRGIFGELIVPLAKSLEAQFAVRFDDYSDFGNTTNPKVALRWAPPGKQWLVRGSYSTGFRAPTLSDLYYPQFNGNTNGSHNDPVRCPGGNPIGGFVDSGNECDIQFDNLSGGNRSLQPEKSHQWAFGFVFEPTPSFSVGTDFWSIRRKDSLGTIGDGTIFENYGGIDPVTALGYFVRYPRATGGGCVNDIPGSPATPANQPCAIDYVIQVQQNLGKYNVTGQDFSFAFRFAPSPWGQLSLKGEGTYIHQYRYQTAKNAEYNDNVGRHTTDNGVINRWKHHISLRWRSGAWGATLSQNFALGYKDDETNGNPPRRVASAETWDLQGTWGGWRGLGVTLGVRNLFDRDPPASANSQNFQVGYDPNNTDPRGRTFYATLKYAFK